MARKKFGSGKYWLRLNANRAAGWVNARYSARIGRLFLCGEVAYNRFGFRFDIDASAHPTFRVFLNDNLIESDRNIWCVHIYLGWLHFYNYAGDMKGLS